VDITNNCLTQICYHFCYTDSCSGSSFDVLFPFTKLSNAFKCLMRIENIQFLYEYLRWFSLKFKSYLWNKSYVLLFNSISYDFVTYALWSLKNIIISGYNFNLIFINLKCWLTKKTHLLNINDNCNIKLLSKYWIKKGIYFPPHTHTRLNDPGRNNNRGMQSSKRGSSCLGDGGTASFEIDGQ